MDFGKDEFELEILNTGDTVRNMDQFVRVAGEYV